MSNALATDRTALPRHSQDPDPYVRSRRTAANWDLGQSYRMIDRATKGHLTGRNVSELGSRSDRSPRDVLHSLYKCSGRATTDDY
jgi:hypothetical protein